MMWQRLYVGSKEVSDETQEIERKGVVLERDAINQHIHTAKRVSQTVIEVDRSDNRYMCARCTFPNDADMIQCEVCEGWTHYKCTELPSHFLSFICVEENEIYYSMLLSKIS